MSLPAEDRSQELEETPSSPEETAISSDVPTEPLQSSEVVRDQEDTNVDQDIEAIIQKVSEHPTVHTRVQISDKPGMLAHFVDILATSTLLRSDLFLSIIALTLLNALIFIHYARTPQSAYDLKSANKIVREDLRRDYDYLEPITDFLNLHGDFKSPTNPEFASSLGRLRAKLGSFGLDGDSQFFQDEFLQKNGGLYWVDKGDRNPTVYQPELP